MPAALLINGVVERATPLNSAIDVKTPITGAMLSESGLIAFTALNAVDGDTGSQAWHTDTSVPGAWLRVDLGAGNARKPQFFRIFTTAANAAIYDVEFSDDAATWTKAAIGLAMNPGAWAVVGWTDVGAHRYWRLLLTNTPGGGPYITEIEFWERPPVDVATYGFTLAEAPGWLDAPPRQTPSASIIGRGGAKRLAAAMEQSRRVTLRGMVRGTTVALARANIDALKLALLADPLSLTFADHPDRHVFASLESFTAPPLVGSFVQESLPVEAVLMAHDPLSYDNVLTSFATASIRMALGTGPVRPVITILGAITNPQLVLNNTAVVTVATMQLTLTTVAGDVLVIDHDRKTITLNGANQIAALTSGDFFVIDPADTQFGPPGPDLLVAGAGAATKNTSFRRSWR